MGRGQEGTEDGRRSHKWVGWLKKEMKGCGIEILVFRWVMEGEES